MFREANEVADVMAKKPVILKKSFQVLLNHFAYVFKFFVFDGARCTNKIVVDSVN